MSQSERKLSALCALLSTQLLHMRDCTNNLYKAGVYSTSRAEFQLLPRSYLNNVSTDENKSDVIVKISDWTFPYGFEYHGAYARLGLTSGGDQALFKLAYAMKTHMGATLHIEDNNGGIETSHTLHLSRLATILGRPFVVMTSNEATTIHEIYRTVMKKSIYRGAVGCVMAIYKLLTETVGHLGQCLCTIRNAFNNKHQTKITLNIGDLSETLHLKEQHKPGRSSFTSALKKFSGERRAAKLFQNHDHATPNKRGLTNDDYSLSALGEEVDMGRLFIPHHLRSGLPFFMTVSPSPPSEPIPLRLQAALRNVTITAPSVDALCRSLLLSAGFVSTDRLSKTLNKALTRCTEVFPEIEWVYYTTIASAVHSAAKHLEKIRQSKTEIALEVESTLDVWSRHNDAEEASALRHCLVKSIYQQIMGWSKTGSKTTHDNLAGFMEEQFSEYNKAHADPTKLNPRDRDALDTFEEMERNELIRIENKYLRVATRLDTSHLRGTALLQWLSTSTLRVGPRPATSRYSAAQQVWGSLLCTNWSFT